MTDELLPGELLLAVASVDAVVEGELVLDDGVDDEPVVVLNSVEVAGLDEEVLELSEVGELELGLVVVASALRSTRNPLLFTTGLRTPPALIA